MDNKNVSKELEIFKKYGYTVEQMVNLDFYLTTEEIKALPKELTDAFKSYASKVSIPQTAPASTPSSMPSVPSEKSFFSTTNPFLSFVVGLGLGGALVYFLKTKK